MPQATSLLEAALWHYAIKVACRCGHAAAFNPHGLWWHFERRGWDDKLRLIPARFWCRACHAPSGLSWSRKRPAISNFPILPLTYGNARLGAFGRSASCPPAASRPRPNPGLVSSGIRLLRTLSLFELSAYSHQRSASASPCPTGGSTPARHRRPCTSYCQIAPAPAERPCSRRRERGVETSSARARSPISEAGWHARMSNRLAGKGACACASVQVSNIRLRPSLREVHRATGEAEPIC
jgi:hypothetical protein